MKKILVDKVKIYSSLFINKEKIDSLTLSFEFRAKIWICKFFLRGWIENESPAALWMIINQCSHKVQCQFGHPKGTQGVQIV